MDYLNFPKSSCKLRPVVSCCKQRSVCVLAAAARRGKILHQDGGSDMKFYICKHCGNIIAYVRSSGVPVVRCGEPMQEIIPGTTDGALEKHACHRGRGQQRDCARRRCGTPHAARALHRMDRAGDGSGNQRKPLAPGQKPEAVCLWPGPRATALWPRTSTATCTACGRPEKLPLRRAGPSAHRVIQKTCPVPEGMGRVFYFHRSVSARTSLPGTAGERAARTCGNG